jgi:branched-chain amino acid transport system substrate-binding protein
MPFCPTKLENRKEEEMFSHKKWSSLFALVVIVGLVLSACAAPTPQVIEKEKVVEKPVVQTVVVEKEKVVEKPVVQTVVVEVTPVPTPTTAAPAKDKIVVGMSRPLSGPLAVIGDSAFRPVYETWVAEVNAEGGIYVAEYGKKLPIELKIYDDKSDVGTMTRLTEKLIVEDKVDFLWPACGTAFIFAQAPIANKYGYVLLTAEGGATTIKDMLPSMPYVFVNLSFSDWYQLPVLADLLAEKGAKTAYIMYIADLHGIEYSGVAGIEFPKRGIEILGVKSVPPDIKDLSPIIKEAKASGADVFCAFAYPDQIMPATGTSIELGFNPKAWVGGPRGQFRVLPHRVRAGSGGSDRIHRL